jgi:hypothetical protein
MTKTMSLVGDTDKNITGSSGSVFKDHGSLGADHNQTLKA